MLVTCAALASGGAAAPGCATRAEVGVNDAPVRPGDADASAAVEPAAAGEGPAIDPGATPEDATGLAASAFATCARSARGGVSCWGDNGYGELGQASSTPSSTRPVRPRALPDDVVALSGASFAFCALTSSARAFCWGDAVFGDFAFAGGGGTVEGVHAVTYEALEVAGLPDDTVAVRAGLYFGCALGRRGDARCWGLNERGQLGTGATVHVFVPTDVEAGGARLRDVAPARAGRFACGTTREGAVLCWGDNASGQLGDGTLVARARPGAVTGFDAPAVQVGAGRLHACARLEDGGVACWGGGAVGQLGDGAAAARPSAARVPGVHGAVALTVGDDHACALDAAGGVTCWGANDRAQATGGTPSVAVRAAAVPAANLPGGRVVELAASRLHTCARDDAGAVRCWGYASATALGDGVVVP